MLPIIIFELVERFTVFVAQYIIGKCTLRNDEKHFLLKIVKTFVIIV